MWAHATLLNCFSCESRETLEYSPSPRFKPNKSLHSPQHTSFEGTKNRECCDLNAVHSAQRDLRWLEWERLEWDHVSAQIDGCKLLF